MEDARNTFSTFLFSVLITEEYVFQLVQADVGTCRSWRPEVPNSCHVANPSATGACTVLPLLRVPDFL